MHRFLLVSILLLVGLPPAIAQVVDRDPDDEVRRNSFTAGGHVHTFGWGGDLQYRRLLQKHFELLIAGSISNIKNKDEVKIPAPGASYGSHDVVVDKTNYCYPVALLGGIQYLVVPSTEFSKVQFKAGLSAGPSFALLKPYYVDVADDNGNVVAEQYRGQSYVNTPYVFGASDVFNGLNEIATYVGARVRIDLTLDLTGRSYLVRALQGGFQLDAYPHALPIMYSKPNQAQYYGFFLGILLGSAW